MEVQETQIVEPIWGRDVGRVTVQMKLENYGDLAMVVRGSMPAEQVRFLEIEALVDCGARNIGLPASVISKLGLHFVQNKQERTAAGLAQQRVFSAVRVTVQDRYGVCEVSELPEDSPALLGQIPLEQMDYWIDMTHQRLVGNPEHGGQWMIDMF